MADLAPVIGVTIDSTGARSGASSVIAEYNRIITGARPVSAANDNIAKSLDSIGKSSKGAASGGGAVSKALDEIRGRAASATPAVGGLVNSLMAFGPQAAIIGGIALAIGAIGSAAIDAASKQQQWLAQLETMTGSAQRAKESYAALVAFAAKTPFDLEQSVQAFTKLRSLGLAATEQRLTSFGNTAAAMGKSMNQMIEAVADASTGEFERLKEFGIKSKTEGDKVKFTFQGVTTEVGKNATEITKYLEGIGNTKFAGAMAKQMDTLKGAFSNVKDNAFQLLAAMGEGALGASVKSIAKSVAGGLASLTPFMASIGNVIGSIIQGVGSVVDGLGQMWAGFGAGQSAISLLDGVTIAMNLIGQGAQVLGSVVGAGFQAIGTAARLIADAIGLSFGGVLDWLGIKFESGGRSWANSIVGILRGVKYVVSVMPSLFATAINDIIRMFSNLGNIISRLLSGESFGNILTTQFKATMSGLSIAGKQFKAIKDDVKGADAAIGRLRGIGTTTPKLDTGMDAKPTPGGSKAGGADSAASKAEQLAKQIEDFWKKLEGDGKDADALWKALQTAANEGKNLAVVSADISKELEFQRLVGRDINAAERERLATAMQQGRTAKFFSDQLVKSAERSMDLGQQEQLLKLRQSGVSEEQLKIEKAVLENREGALKAGVDLTSEAFKANEAALRVDLQREQAIGRQNAELDKQVQLMKDAAANGTTYARTAMRDFGTVAQRKTVAETENKEVLKGLRAALDAGKISSAEFEAGTKRAGEELQERFREIGDEFSNKMNRAADLLGDIGAAIGGKGGKAISGLSNIARGIGNFDSTKDLITDDFKKIFGEKSDLAKGIGGAVGGAMAGLKIGESIADLGKVFGANKGFQKGAKIGGAIGGLTGNPAIAAGASVIGGIIGGLLYKPKFGTAQLTGSGDPVISGRGAKQKAAASGAAGSVQEALSGIAAELGGQIGNYMVSIGTYKDKWRVSTSGSTGKLKTSRGAVDFGDDQGAAIAFAVEDAIKDGAITGLSDVIQKALKGLGTDSAIQFAKDWNAVMDDFRALTDPVGAAIESITKPLDTLRNTMLSIGASSTDLAKLEEYRSLKMKEVLEEQTSGFRDLLKNLNGDGGGVTALNQLTRNMSEFDKFRSDIAAGKTVDQSKFTDLANSILSGANSVYGTNTKDFQNIVSMLKDATNGAIGLVEAQFNPAQAAQAQIDAMKSASDAAVAEAAISNDYLSQILTAIQLNGVIAGAIGGGGRGEVWGGAPNGRIVNAY